MNEESLTAWTRAVQLVQFDRWPEAFRYTRQAIAADVTAPEPHNLMAVILIENGYPEKAVIEAREACRLEPEDADHHRVLALAYAFCKQLPEARAEIALALELNPNDVYIYNNGARIEALGEAWKSAEAFCRSGLELDPDNESLLMLLAYVVDQQGRGAESRDILARALQLDPESPSAQRMLGQLLMREGDVQSAREAFRESLRLNPEQDDWWHEQSVKGSSVWYRPFLRFTLFMARLPRYYALALAIGLWAVHLWIARFSEDNPGFRPYGLIISGLYVAFVLYTWLADPIANALLKRRGSL